MSQINDLTKKLINKIGFDEYINQIRKEAQKELLEELYSDYTYMVNIDAEFEKILENKLKEFTKENTNTSKENNK